MRFKQMCRIHKIYPIETLFFVYEMHFVSMKIITAALSRRTCKIKMIKPNFLVLNTNTYINLNVIKEHNHNDPHN